MPQQSERQKRKAYEKEHPDLGGYLLQAVVVGLFGCLFCVGHSFEKHVEKVKNGGGGEGAGEKERGGGGGEGGRSRHGGGSRRGRSRRSRSFSEDGDGRGHDGRRSYDGRRSHGSRGVGDKESSYGYVDPRAMRLGDNRISYIPAAVVPMGSARGEGTSESSEGIRRWVGGEDMYEMEEESPPPTHRRRRVKRGE